jgi:hypothetical protein
MSLSKAVAENVGEEIEEIEQIEDGKENHELSGKFSGKELS